MMDAHEILVMGVSGQQGGAVACSLIERGQPFKAISRTASKIQQFSEAGCVVCEADLSNPDSLARELEGVKRVYLVTSPFESGPDGEIEQGVNFVDAAAAAGVEDIVYSSVSSADAAPDVPHFESKRIIERYIAATAMSATILRPVWFMTNFGSPWCLPSILSGALRLPLLPSRPMQMVSLETIGNFGAEALLHPSAFGGRTIDLACDEMTMPEAMRLLSHASGMPIRYEVMSEAESYDEFGPDFAKMFHWFNEVGYDVNITGLAKWGIELQSFRQYLSDASWVRNLRQSARPGREVA